MRFPLPSDGWKPGDGAELALTGGSFHAVLKRAGACAWLGSGDMSYFWPAGYTVRFHPTVLLDGQGHVVAKEGEHLKFGGGERPALTATRCSAQGQSLWNVQSNLLKP